MGKYFGTDGFRGEAGIDLTADHAYKVGRFLGWYYNMLRERQLAVMADRAWNELKWSGSPWKKNKEEIM